MKRIPIIAIILTAALIIAVILVARDARSETPLERNSADVNMFLTTKIPAYPDVDPITAQAYSKPFIYWTGGEKGKALIRGEDLPMLVYATKDFYGDLGTLTVMIEGIPGTTATLDWTSYPTVKLSPVELRVKAYTKDYVELTEEDQPIVDIILSDITMTTEEVCVKGWCDKGYLDAEKLEAQVVFSAELPEADYAPYKKWLEGQEILGTFRVQVPNPFASQK
jgi:hypothetical protein